MDLALFIDSIGNCKVYRRFSFFWWGGSTSRGGYVGGSFHGETFHGGTEFSIKGTLDFQALLKKDQTLQKKQQVSSAQSKEQD